MKKLFPIVNFRDSDGSPLAGGKIYTYITGTTTPKKTYSDSEGLIPHTNPIILGSDGSVKIWMDTDASYALKVYDKNDVQVGSTIDNVEPTLAQATSVGGADIDITGYAFVTTSNDDLRLNPHGTGKVKINDAYFLPIDMPSQNEVLSGNGTTTAVWSTPSAVNLDGLSNVTITSATTGQLLKYNGSAWVNSAQSTLSITASQVSDLATSTIAFTNKTGAISQWTNDSNYITSSSSNALTNKSGNISQWTNDSGYAALPAGSQSNAEAGTSSSVSMTPAIMQNHPGIAKAWVQWTSGASPSIGASYNVSSVTHDSTGIYTITFTTAFSSANYVALLGNTAISITSTSIANGETSANAYMRLVEARAAESIQVRITNSSFNLTDTAQTFDFYFYGDQ